MTTDHSFARLVSLACHDLRTPLATAFGFARTLPRVTELGAPASRYVGMIEAAAAEMATLLDDLALVARIEAGRFEPEPRAVEAAALARAAAARVDAGRVDVRGRDRTLLVAPEAAERAIAGFATCALRHGRLDRVSLHVRAGEIALTPVRASVAPVLLGEDLRDLGAAVAARVIPALGGSLELEGEALQVRLPPAT